ncbi:retinol dehydrogenase [Rugosimonospora africana]|uniref:Retinol dehydrogenase n=2 Tax=Rugosimonospora africana TaxID=556532 RepID=A0A8J3QTU0_9ACTN|nr:retinol dehydrogenase [Rugosimonospora africana]
MHSNLTGKVCMVTGANRGIGYATSVALARAGAIVTLVGRDPARLESARDAIRRTTGADRIDYLPADLASQAAVRSLAERFRDRHDRLDVLVNNAATISEQRQVTVDGRERTFAVNHLAYFLLTRLLLDLLVAAHGVVVNVAASRHRDAVEGIEDIDSLTGYEMRSAYIRSKLANVSFTLELARRLGASARANSFCPGATATEALMQFARIPPEQWQQRLAQYPSPDTAAEVAMSVITSPGTGRYLEDGVDVTPSPQALDQDLARRLWSRCSALTGLPED